MRSKVLEMEKVKSLRRQGLTYREILKQVSVSKSSVSLWLKDFPLTDQEKKILKKRKDSDISRWRLRAAASLRVARETREKILLEEAHIEFDKHIHEPFFQLGIALYWAEGAKRANMFSFINSDVEMTRLMLRWIQTYLLVGSVEQIKMRVFTHKAFEHEHHEDWWSKQCKIPLSRFGKTIFKTQNGLIVKKRPEYKGCVRIELGKASYFKKIRFWQQMLIEYYKK